MPHLHILKTWPGSFNGTLTGAKTYEVRKNDCDFKVGDFLRLMEFNPDAKMYTGTELIVEVTFMTPGGAWGLPSDLCVMSIAVLSPSAAVLALQHSENVI